MAHRLYIAYQCEMTFSRAYCITFKDGSIPNQKTKLFSCAEKRETCLFKNAFQKHSSKSNQTASSTGIW